MTQETHADLVGLLYEAAVEEMRWPEVFSASHRVFEGVPLQLTCAISATASIERLTQHGFRQISLLGLDALNAPWPFFPCGARPSSSSVAEIHDPEGLLERRPAGWMQPKIEQLRQAYIACGLFSLNQEKDFAIAGVPHTDDNAGKIERIQRRFTTTFQDLSRVIKIRSKMRTLGSTNEIANNLATRCPMAVCVVDQEGVVQFSTEHMAAILQGSSRFSIDHNNRFCISNSAESGYLATAIREASEGCERTIRLDMSHKDFTIVRVAPMQCQSLYGNRALVRLAIDMKPTRQSWELSQLLKDLYGLTEAESRVAHGLFHTGDLREVAEEAGVTINTVRTQLKSLLHKTGVNSQVKLVLKIAHHASTIWT